MTTEILDRIIEYYTATYKIHNFRKLFGGETDDSIIIRVMMDKFERCQISSEIFSSTMSS